MAAAVAAKQWLLVNVQEAGALPSLVLNRDVWADRAMRSLLGTSYVLWQRSHMSMDASAYGAYYPAERLPHVAVLDPRTGERLLVWGERPGEAVSLATLLPALTAFAAQHVCEGTALGPAHAADKAPEVSTRRDGIGASAADRARAAAAEAARQAAVAEEQAQLMAAIEASLAECGAPGGLGGAGGGEGGLAPDMLSPTEEEMAAVVREIEEEEEAAAAEATAAGAAASIAATVGARLDDAFDDEEAAMDDGNDDPHRPPAARPLGGREGVAAGAPRSDAGGGAPRSSSSSPLTVPAQGTPSPPAAVPARSAPISIRPRREASPSVSSSSLGGAATSGGLGTSAASTSSLTSRALSRGQSAVDAALCAERVLKAEQDAEYHAALAADRAAEAAAAAAAAAEAAAAAAAAEEVAAIATAAARLGDEPAAGTAGVLVVALRLACGRRVVRRFATATSGAAPARAVLGDWVTVASGGTAWAAVSRLGWPYPWAPLTDAELDGALGDLGGGGRGGGGRLSLALGRAE